MSPKSPDRNVLRDCFTDAIRELHASGGSDAVTVNNVRSWAESKLDLEDGLLKSPEWKSWSKTTIAELFNTVLSDPKPSQDAASPGNNAKHSSPGEASPKPKRRKVESQESTSDLSEVPDPDEDDEEEPAPKKRKIAARPRSKKASQANEKGAVRTQRGKPNGKAKKNSKKHMDSEEEDNSGKGEDADDAHVSSDDEQLKTGPEKKDTKKKVPARKQKTGPKQSSAKETEKSGNDESELSDPPEETEEAEIPSQPKEDASKVDVNDSDSTTLSDLIDEPPKRKRGPKGAPRKAPKQKGDVSKPGKATADLPPDEAEIKKLQSQLVKCGIRKIWAFELKKYGEDNKAKIRHLKGALKDIGMDGRFSEAKAKEVKERRELQADLEAVTEMNKNWGSGRASRSRAVNKSGREASGAGSGEEQDEDVSDAATKPTSRPRGSAKYRADLAFLGDDSESE